MQFTLNLLAQFDQERLTASSTLEDSYLTDFVNEKKSPQLLTETHQSTYYTTYDS